ncbi:MAG: DUF1778 domain-containing protein [Acidimicrobiales bacterium]|jgi:uncharacterized protein (DUF1778 family)
MAREERLEARLSADAARSIANAATLEGMSRSSFVVAAAVERADAVLRQHRETVVAWEHAENFLTWLDAPAEVRDGLKELANAPRFDHR